MVYFYLPDRQRPSIIDPDGTMNGIEINRNQDKDVSGHLQNFGCTAENWFFSFFLFLAFFFFLSVAIYPELWP